MRSLNPFICLGILLPGLALASLFLGRYPEPYWLPLRALWEDPLAWQLVVHLRLPRIICAVLLGMALSAGGAVMQLLFRNPLVEPGFLGVSQGAAMGAAAAIIFAGGTPWVVQACATGCAFLGLMLSAVLARRIVYGGWILRLVLAGMAVSAAFSAGLGLLKCLADPLRQLPEITFWLMGGLWAVQWTDVRHVAPVVIPALLVIWLMRWRISLLALSDETAFSLGVSAGRERAFLLLVAVAAVAVLVAVAGVVGWVGLLVPHIARRLMGADARRSVPASMVLGGIFMLLSDDAARTLLAAEIPVGILTSLLGAAFFMGLMIFPARGGRA